MTWYQMIFVGLLLLAMVVGGRRGFLSSLFRSIKFLITPVFIYFWSFPIARSIIDSLKLDRYMEMGLQEVINPVTANAEEQVAAYLEQLSVSEPSHFLVQESLRSEKVMGAGLESMEIIELLAGILAVVFALHAAFLLIFIIAFLLEKIVLLLVETFISRTRIISLWSRFLGGLLTAGHAAIFLAFILILIQPVFDFFIIDFPEYLNPYGYLKSWLEPFISPWLVDQIRNFVLGG